MKETILLSDVEAGEMFDFGGVAWIKLYEAEVTGILTFYPVKTSKFGETNDWRTSELRSFLNLEFREKLIENGANEGDFKAFTSYLTDCKGGKDYGTSVDYIGLLSRREAWRHIKEQTIADLESDFWWTLTPYNGEHAVAIITPWQKIDMSAPGEELEVRAYCRVKNDLEVIA